MGPAPATRALRNLPMMQITKIIAFAAVIVAVSAYSQDADDIVPEGELDVPSSQDTDFVDELDAVYGLELVEIKATCAGAKGKSKKALEKVKASMKMVKNAVDRKMKLCKAQADADEKTAKEKKKLKISGPTFKFKKDVCKGGKGTFKKMMKKGDRAVIGVIPAKQNNVKVFSQVKDDVDLEVWGPFGKVAIVAFSCKSMNRALGHKTPTHCLDNPNKDSIKFAGCKIQYSGYEGSKNKHGFRDMGNEYIKISGKCNEALTLKAFGWVKGLADVNYSWGADKAECKKKMDAEKAKHDAMVASKKAMKEKDFKKVQHVLDAATKTCTGAKGGVSSAEKALTFAHQEANKWKDNVHKCVEKATKEKSKKKEQNRKKELAKKAAKEKKNKAQEQSAKKEQAKKNKKKEEAAKEKLKKAAEKAEKKAKAEKGAKKKAAEAAKKVAEQALKKERSKKQREQAKKSELAKKAKEKQKKVEKALKHKHEKTAKKKEKETKEATAKEVASKERNSKREKKAKKAQEKAAKEADAKNKARAAAVAAERKKKEIYSKRCRTRKWATNYWYAWTDCCRGCDGRSPAPGGMRGACIWRRKYNIGKDKSQCGCRATPSGTTDFKTNTYYAGVDCCAGCRAAQSQCIRRDKGFAWTSVCTCRMSC